MGCLFFVIFLDVRISADEKIKLCQHFQVRSGSCEQQPP